MLRQALLQLSKSTTVRHVIETAPVSRGVVKRFVAGGGTSDAVRVATELTLSHRLVTVDFLGEDTPTWPGRAPPGTPTSSCCAGSPTRASPRAGAPRRRSSCPRSARH